MNEKDDMITHLGILSNLENGRQLARFSNSPETGTSTLDTAKSLAKMCPNLKIDYKQTV